MLISIKKSSCGQTYVVAGSNQVKFFLVGHLRDTDVLFIVHLKALQIVYWRWVQSASQTYEFIVLDLVFWEQTLRWRIALGIFIGACSCKSYQFGSEDGRIGAREKLSCHTAATRSLTLAGAPGSSGAGMEPTGGPEWGKGVGPLGSCISQPWLLAAPLGNSSFRITEGIPRERCCCETHLESGALCTVPQYLLQLWGIFYGTNALWNTLWERLHIGVFPKWDQHAAC